MTLKGEGFDHMTLDPNVDPRPTVLDAFCGQGGAALGYWRAGYRVIGVDKSKAHLARYPFESHRADAIEFILEHGHKFTLAHASPTCTGFSAGTRAIPDRLTRYDRLIGATREAFNTVGVPYVIENVMGARSELRTPVMLCGRMFGLTAYDDDGTLLTLDRHRLFESNLPLMQPEHAPHGWKSNRVAGIQVAGSYGGARRDKVEARVERRGGYVPKSLLVQQELLGTHWMNESGCKLSIPPAYTQWIGTELKDLL